MVIMKGTRSGIIFAEIKTIFPSNNSLCVVLTIILSRYFQVNFYFIYFRLI
jgi:hypothetical protein